MFAAWSDSDSAMSGQSLSWEIRWTRAALTGLRRLPAQEQRRIVLALDRYATVGHGDIVRIVGTEGLLRLRVGDWRIRFRTWLERIAPDEQTDTATGRRIIEVLAVRHRNAAYRDL
jgi:mRNA interferase RelE/StbE